MNPETRCALYCRVSTIGKGQDTEVQARVAGVLPGAGFIT